MKRPKNDRNRESSYESFTRVLKMPKAVFELAGRMDKPTDRLQDFTLSSRGDETQEFQTLKAFSAATGQEKHGVMLDYDVLQGERRS